MKDITTPEERAAGFKFILMTEKDYNNKKMQVTKVYKKMTCNMPNCNKTFWAELDKAGIPYQHRCDRCTQNLKNAARISRNKIEYRERVIAKKSRTVCDD